MQGTRGPEYVNQAAEEFSDEKFASYYQSRAAHILKLHRDVLSEKAIERLEAFIG